MVPRSSAENYLQEAVNVVQEIHRKEGPGDILVFLTSPVETERACEKLRMIEPDPNLVCLPLHGKLRQEEQRRVVRGRCGQTESNICNQLCGDIYYYSRDKVRGGHWHGKRNDV